MTTQSHGSGGIAIEEVFTDRQAATNRILEFKSGGSWRRLRARIGVSIKRQSTVRIERETDEK